MHLGSLFTPLGGNCLNSTIGMFTNLLEYFLHLYICHIIPELRKELCIILCDLALKCLTGNDATDLSELAFEAKSFKDDAW